MNLESVNTKTPAYETNQVKSDVKTDAKTDAKPAETEKKDTAASGGAVYEKTPADSGQSATYKINKMSADDRASLVKQLKAEQANRESQLLDIVNKMISKQANTFAQSNDSMWQFLSKGNLSVDAATKAQAMADVSEDGYYGVKQTSQRLFDFASALAGDDVDQMKKMQDAFEKGFKQAEDLWGGEGKLPKISYETRDAVNKMFDDYYKSKQTITDQAQNPTV